jgi:hypothetical protein
VPVRLVSQNLSFRPGQEAHSDPVRLARGEGLRLRGRGSVGVYSGVYAEEYYQAVVRKSPGDFPFPFGTDRRIFEETYRAPREGFYRAVLRAAKLNRAGEVHFEVELLGITEVPPRCRNATHFSGKG